MKKVAFHTLGCKVNQYESQAMSQLFEKGQYKIVPDTEAADVYVINTCTVTNISDRKSRQFIRRAKNQNRASKIVVVGCYAQIAPEEVLRIEGVNLVLGTNERNKIVEYVESLIPESKINAVDDIMKVEKFEALSVQEIKGKTRAFLKIQEGCNQYCTYCIIPYARGHIRSRMPEDILEEVQQLVENGFQEIVLTGIHVASYGKDFKEQHALLDLLKALNAVLGLKRIRLSSLEPTLLTPAFIQELSQLEKICPHFHLSLQSGCDKTLKKMNRKYTTAQYEVIVKNIRSVFPEIALTTDVIVGFPGETDEDFETTLQYVNAIGFSDIHVFKFSPRKGTPAADFPDQVDGMKKHQRSERLIQLVRDLRRRYQEEFLGRKAEVLFEIKSKDDSQYVEGHTGHYIKVLVLAEQESVEGTLKTVELIEIKEEAMLGRIF